MTSKIKLYTFPLSGHSHRVELFANLAGIDHETEEVNLGEGAHKQEDFLAINPAGQVPGLVDGDVAMGDSNTILTYLARKYAPEWLPVDAEPLSQIQRFLSLAAGEIRFGPALARLSTVFGAEIDVEKAKGTAEWVFGQIEQHLAGRQWLVGARPTIADVAIYSYTAHAPEGNVSLADFPNIRAWLQRVEDLPNFVAMPATKVGLAA